ncbi:hypothetical protein SAMN05421809_3595 [Natronorubrum daqingense]|uniref:Uncharacterized protein n=1 Tax=Natronorubrum daqingense TaxID=588898 RepID=A0A1N7FZF7_9EURY|nr:hypothetical protein SAMN05421809_3595 [Natronorubrum daqingense]
MMSSQMGSSGLDQKELGASNDAVKDGLEVTKYKRN